MQCLKCFHYFVCFASSVWLYLVYQAIYYFGALISVVSELVVSLVYVEGVIRVWYNLLYRHLQWCNSLFSGAWHFSYTLFGCPLA